MGFHWNVQSLVWRSSEFVPRQVEINIPSLPGIRDFDRIHCTIGSSSSKAIMVDSMVRCNLPPPNRLPPTPPHQGTTLNMKLQTLEYDSDIHRFSFYHPVLMTVAWTEYLIRRDAAYCRYRHAQHIGLTRVLRKHNVKGVSWNSRVLITVGVSIVNMDMS